MEKSLEFSKSSGRMGKYSDFGYKKVAQEKLVMWIFCILTVVVVAQIYKCDKNCRELNTQTEKAMAPHSSTLAWKIPWMEEPGRLQSMGSLRVGHNWVTSLSLFTFMHWKKKWQPTPVCLPGESQGRGSLVGCHLWGYRVGHDWSDLAANTHIGTHMSACKTDEIWIHSVNYVNVSFLTVILYYRYATVMLCFWGKLHERAMESLYFAQLHVNL